MLTAFQCADILLPRDADMTKWSVVACDQYTSEPEYWKETEKIVGDNPSSLRLILPECYLGKDGEDEKIKNIRENMKKYLSENFFEEYKNSLIYVERETSDGIRQGIVGKIDLEEYDYSKGSSSAVRATEATVKERIPPRIKIRDGAALELPHIMILIDDPEKTVVEPLLEKKQSMKKLYDFELMQNGGNIKGYLLNDEDISAVDKALAALADPEAFGKKYNTDSAPLVFAMGDGNHSLATAKEYYESLKRQNPDKDMSSHPARYALCEIVNLHSDALRFEAIHRIVTDVNADELLEKMKASLKLSETEKSGQKITTVIKGKRKDYYIHNPSSNLTVGSLQNFLDENKCTVDYIHGENVTEKLSMNENSVGFILPRMEKNELFPTVIKDGALPRKTFSMGHADDKRFYTEARKI